MCFFTSFVLISRNLAHILLILHIKSVILVQKTKKKFVFLNLFSYFVTKKINTKLINCIKI